MQDVFERGKPMNLKAFGTRLQEARMKTGLSTNRVSDIIGISQPTISRYENARIVPTVDRLYALAKLYGCSMDWLCGMEGERK